MSMALQVRDEDGNFSAYENFTRLFVAQNIEEISGEFNFDAVDVEGEFNEEDYPVKIGSLCRVTVDDVPVLTGYIEVINIQSDSNSHSVSLSGRDVTCDLIDSTIPSKLNFTTAQITLEDLINEVQASIGLALPAQPPLLRREFAILPVINNVPDLKPFLVTEIESPEPGQNAFDFLQQYARKRQVILTKDGNGSIVITRSVSLGLGVSMLRLRNNENLQNNIISSAVSYDYTERFYRYIFGSSGNMEAANQSGEISNETLTDTLSEVLDERTPRTTRTLYLNAENSSSGEDLGDRARWEANIRRIRSRQYSCVLNTLTVRDGVPFWFNKLSSVRDDVCGVNDLMLVKSVSFVEDLQEGQTTELEFVDKDAYSERLDKDPQELETNTLGNNFVLRSSLASNVISDAVNNNISKSASDLLDEVIQDAIFSE